MSATAKPPLSIPASLLEQADTLAAQLEISRNQVLVRALEQLIERHQRDVSEPPHTPGDAATAAAHTVDRRAAVHQGDVYWVQGAAAESSIAHPHVVIQDDVLNHSRLPTVVVCALTSNTKRASLPGNVLLAAGEAGLPKQSVVEASKVSTVTKTQLGDYIGSVSDDRIQQILAGMRFLQRSFFAR